MTWAVPDDYAHVSDAVGRLDRALVLFAVEDALEEMSKNANVLGSLLKPGEMIEATFARKYHRDPPIFRKWLAAEFWRYVRCRRDAEAFLAGEPSPVPEY